MKKFLSLVLCLALALLCVGCSAPDDGGSSSDLPTSVPDTQSNADKDDSSTVTENFSYTVNSSLPDYNIKITYNSVENKNISSLSLFDEKSSKEIQHFDLKENEPFTKKAIYFTDITFDGYADVLVPCKRPASAQYFMAFVWDSATNKLVYAPTFETLANAALDSNEKVILSRRAADRATTYSISVFDKDLNDFKKCKSFYFYPEHENIIYKEETLENGSMQVIFEKSIPYDDDYVYYSMHPEIKSRYEGNPDWDFNSSKWQQYIIPFSESLGY